MKCNLEQKYSENHNSISQAMVTLRCKNCIQINSMSITYKEIYQKVYIQFVYSSLILHIFGIPCTPKYKIFENVFSPQFWLNFVWMSHVIGYNLFSPPKHFYFYTFLKSDSYLHEILCYLFYGRLMISQYMKSVENYKIFFFMTKAVSRI